MHFYLKLFWSLMTATCKILSLTEFFSWDNFYFYSRPFRFALTALRHFCLLSPSSSGWSASDSPLNLFILYISQFKYCVVVKVMGGEKALVFPVLKNRKISCRACRKGEGNGEKCLSFRNEHFKNLRECFKSCFCSCAMKSMKLSPFRTFLISWTYICEHLTSLWTVQPLS